MSHQKDDTDDEGYLFLSGAKEKSEAPSQGEAKKRKNKGEAKAIARLLNVNSHLHKSNGLRDHTAMH